METPTARQPKTTYRHRRSIRCQTCKDTGIVRTYEPALIGHTSNGTPVHNHQRLVLMQHWCECWTGKHMKGGDAA